MKSIIYLTVLLLISFNSLASHILGGDIYYEQISDREYRVSVTLYRDCNGVELGNTLAIAVARENEANSLMNFNITRSSISVVPNLCTVTSNKCSGSGRYGIQKHVYSGVFTIPTALENTNFEMRYSDCCKSGAITNLNNATNLNTYLRVTIKRPTGIISNTGPVFLSDPVYFTPTSASQTYSYSHMAYDMEGDSLVYRIEPVLVGFNNQAGYNGGYSSTLPFGNGTTVSIDPRTGLLSITGVSTEICCTYIVAVDEYRDGVLISITRREVSLLFKNPSSEPQVISDFVSQPGDFITLSCDQEFIRDTLYVRDLDVTDLVYITLITSSPFISIQPVTPANPVRVVVEYNMNQLEIGDYYITINSNDNRCPFPLTGNRTFRVHIVDTIPPVPIIDTLYAECSVDAPFAQATDNCRGLVTGTTTDPLSFSSLGTYSVNWNFDDLNGNSSTAIQHIIVRDITAPVPSTLADINGECEATAPIATAQDNCMGQILGVTTDPLTYTSQGTHIINWTFEDGNGNISTTTQKVIVKDVTPPVPPVLSPISECGQAFSPVPTAQDNCVGTVTGITTDPVSFSTPGVYNVNWVFNDGNGNSSSAIQVVTVLEVPVVNPVATVNVCNGVNQSVALTASIPSTFVWTNSNSSIGLAGSGTGSIPSFITTNTTNEPITGIISVTPTANGCVGPVSTFNIVVQPNTKLVASVNTPQVCKETTAPVISLNFSNGEPNYSLSYQINGGSNQSLVSAGNTASIIVPTDVAGDFAYRFTGITNGGALACSTTIDTVINVKIFELPTVDAGVDAIVCPRDNYILASSGTAVDYLWTNGKRNGDIISVETPTNFIVKGTDVNGCIYWDTVFVDLFIPSVVDAGLDQIICFKDSVVLGAQMLDGTAGVFTWNNGAVDSIAYCPISSDYFNVLAVDLNGCKTSDSLYVLVNALPMMVLPELIRGCANDEVVLQALGVRQGVYVWSNGVQNGSSFYPPVGRNFYTVEVTDLNSCRSKDSVEVFIEKYLTLDLMVRQKGFCYPVEVELINNSPETGTNCTWTLEGIDYSPIAGCGNKMVIIDQAGDFGVTLQMETLQNACVSKITKDTIIHVDEYPNAQFSYSPDVLTEIYSVVDFKNESTLANSYTWTFGDGRSSTLTDPSHDYGPEVNKYVATLFAYSKNGCLDTSVTIIKVGEELIFYIPNAFTPDGNLYNEVFKPVFTSGFDPMDYVLYIYNRWGELVFESRDSEHGWNGRYGESSDVCPDGSYSWVIEVNTVANNSTKRSRFNGHITLLK